MTQVLLATEGVTDRAVGERLLSHLGLTSRVVNDRGGSSAIDAALPRWMAPSNQRPMLILRDWDAADGAACIPALLERIAPVRVSSTVLLRIPCRAIEAWLMADAQACSGFFGLTRLNLDPDSLTNPKLELVDRCRASTKAAIRRQMVPPPGSKRAVGDGYVELLIDYASNHWRPEVARGHSASLNRAIARIEGHLRAGTW